MLRAVMSCELFLCLCCGPFLGRSIQTWVSASCSPKWGLCLTDANCVQTYRRTSTHPRPPLTRSFSPIRYSDAPCHVLSGRLAPCWGRRTNYRRIGASRCHICITDALLYLCLVGSMDRRASDCSVLPLQRPHGQTRSLRSAFVHCMSFVHHLKSEIRLNII